MKRLSFLKTVLVIFLVLFISTPAFCGKPILTIDTGGHKSIVKELIFTKDNRYLISTGYDKTIRVWNVQTGQIDRIIRGQIGDGDEGILYAATLSPDNRWLAVAGFTKDNDIRLIDFGTGEIEKLFLKHNDVIRDLAFSRDGRYIVSSSFDKTAKIWNVSFGKAHTVLKGHTKSVNTAVFSPDGRTIVTGSDDKTLKLWDARTGRLLSTLSGHTDRIRCVEYTPDGRYILSGSNDKTIRLWDGRTGSAIKVLVTQNRAPIKFSISPDSTKVVTGHSSGSGSRTNNIFSIPSGTKVSSITKHTNIVIATAISPDGRLAATGGGDNREIYIWEVATGKIKHKLAGSGGSVWAVGFGKDSGSFAWGTVFNKSSLTKRGDVQHSISFKHGREFQLSYNAQEKNKNNYVYGTTSVGSRSIKTLNGHIHKTLQILNNGQVQHKITRDSTNGFTHRSLTMTRDGRIIISGGGSGQITSYNASTGQQIHQFVGHLGDVWGVACSPDSRFLVSGSADQTVRLWEIDTGKLLLSVFRGTDNQWVAWTPEGYYSASIKGDDYIGWHINQGYDKSALYYPASRFAHKFYSPDIVAQYIATGGNLERSIELVNQSKPKQKQISQTNINDIQNILPPLVFIQTPVNRDVIVRENKVRIKAYAKSVTKDPVSDIWVLLNGRKLDTRAIKVAPRKKTGSLSAELDIVVPLTEKSNSISVVASNKHGRSEPESINVTWQPKKTAPAIKKQYKPDLYLLCIGVSKYKNPAYNLDFADKDAMGVEKIFSTQHGGLYNNVYAKTLTNERATKMKIQESLEWLYQESTQKDLSVIFIAGHGIKDTRNNYYFMPYDGHPDKLMFSAVKWFDFQDIISSLPSKVILMADTCHSGALTGKRRGLSDITQALRDLISADSGVVVMTASTGKELSVEHPDWGHGAFTKALIEGLNGDADYDSDNIIDMKEIDLFITKRVKELTGGSQHPTTEIPKTMPNFPLVVK